MFFSNKNKCRPKRGNAKGKKYEKKVARRLRLGGIKVVSTNKEIYEGNKRVTDIDIETRHANIEVKTCERKSGLGKQLRKYQKHSSKEPIGMAPNLNNRERTQLNEEGFNVFSKEKNLVKYLKEIKKNPEMKRIVSDPKPQRKEDVKNMDNISYVTKELITKEKLEEIFKMAGLKYELGGIEPYENFWVADKKNKAILVANINDVNENGESLTQKEALKEFEFVEALLPENGYVLDVEYADYGVLNVFEKALKSLYPEVYYYDDKSNTFIKL